MIDVLIKINFAGNGLIINLIINRPDKAFNPQSGLNPGIPDQVDLVLCQALPKTQSEGKFRLHQIWTY